MDNDRRPKEGQLGNSATGHVSQLQVFQDLAEFTEAVRKAGVVLDFSRLTSLNTNFLDPAEGHLVLNVKHFAVEDPNNLLFLNSEVAFLYSKLPPTTEEIQGLSRLFPRRYGRSTALAYLVLKHGVANYAARLEHLIEGIRELESEFDSGKYREFSLEFERLYDRLEDMDTILIKLEETGIKEVETRMVSFDYRVLLAECSNLLDRCKNRLNMLRDLARDHELRTTTDLNRMIKKLTSITVILMIPSLVATHFGMNFEYMPELKIWWAYPAVIVFQIVLMAALGILFWKIDWL